MLSFMYFFVSYTLFMKSIRFDLDCQKQKTINFLSSEKKMSGQFIFNLNLIPFVTEQKKPVCFDIERLWRKLLVQN